MMMALFSRASSFWYDDRMVRAHPPCIMTGWCVHNPGLLPSNSGFSLQMLAISVLDEQTGKILLDHRHAHHHAVAPGSPLHKTCFRGPWTEAQLVNGGCELTQPSGIRATPRCAQAEDCVRNIAQLSPRSRLACVIDLMPDEKHTVAYVV
jgi:hypothetical protein